MKIEYVDLIDPKLFEQIDPEHRANLNILLWKVNVLREASQFPFIIRNSNRLNAGYRTVEMHHELYELMGRVPPGRSWHLSGGACDILDIDGHLKAWIKKNEGFVHLQNVSFEHFSATKSWVHLQVYFPPSLGMYFFP